jgi:hypothetical protein
MPRAHGGKEAGRDVRFGALRADPDDVGAQGLSTLCETGASSLLCGEDVVPALAGAGIPDR